MSSNIQTPTFASDDQQSSSERGMLIVVSSPSGGGKGTLIQRALKIAPDVSYSVSYTTRMPREGEVDGREYSFVSVETFRAMEAAGELLESAVVHGNLYGTSLARVEEELSAGRDIMLEIDVQGAENVRRLVPDAVMIFILPPTFQILCERLKARGSESPDEQALRLTNSRHEVEAYRQFDYIIINDEVDRASNQLAAIVHAERARFERQESAAKRVVATFVQTVKDKG